MTLHGSMLLAFGLLIAASAAQAATRNWDGDTSTAWGTAGNWDTLPASDLTTDIANFNLVGPYQASATPRHPTSGNTISINGITIGAANGAMTLTTGTTPGLSIGASGITIANGAGALSVPAASVVTIGANQSWINNDNDAATIGIIALANKLTLAGGVFNFNAANTGTGGLAIEGGTVKLGNTTAAGGGAVTLGVAGDATSGTLDLNGASRTISGALTTAGTAANQTITNSAGAAATLNLTGAATSTFGGVIRNGASATTAVTLNNASAVLTLSGANTYSGVTTLTAGTLAVGHNNALGVGGFTWTAGTLMATNTAISLANNITFTVGTIGGSTNLTLNGSFTFPDAGQTLTVNSSALTTLGGNVYLNTGDLNARVQTINGSGNVTISGVISNNPSVNQTLAQGLTYSGTGTLTLNSPNAFTGAFRINNANATVVAVTPQALGQGTLTLTSGTLKLATDSSINPYNTTVGGNVTIVADRATSGSTITHNLGTLSLGAYTLSVTKGANVTSNASLNFGTVSLTASTPTFDVANGVNLTLGSLVGGQHMAKQGAGTLTLNTAATRNGNFATTLTDGTIRLGSELGLFTTLNENRNFYFNGGTLSVALSTDATIQGTAFSIGGTATLVVDRSGPGDGLTYTFNRFDIAAGADRLFNVLGGDNVTNGTAHALMTVGTTLNTNVTLNIVNPTNGGTTRLTLAAINGLGQSVTLKGNGSFAQTGVFSGTGSGLVLDTNYTGVATLDRANTFSGGVVISNGLLRMGHDSGLGSGGLILGGGTLSATGSFARTIANAVTFTGNPTLGSATDDGALTFTNTWALGAADRTVTVSSVVTNRGVISSTGGGLIKAGGSTLALGTNNTYTGNTTINNGTLKLAGAGAIDTSPVIAVASGASFDVQSVSGGYKVKSGQTLTGAGAVVGNTTLNGGATVNPGGVGTVGTLAITGAVTFSSSSTNVVDISGTTADQLTLTGAVSIASGAVIRFSGTPTSGTTYTLMTAASGITGSPAFTTESLASGWELNYNGTSLTLAEFAREIDVRGNGVSITNNDNTPVVADHTDFGSVGVPGNSNIVRTFTIYNTGTAALSLTGTPLVVVGGAHSNDFTVTLFPVSPVAAGSSTTFNVTFDPSAVGVRTGTLSIANNDADENPYTFSILGTGLASSGPEMDVQGNAVSIADGASTPAASNHTDFGVAHINGGTVVRTFTIRNLGDVTLNLTNTPLVVVGGTHSNDFTVTLTPASSVAPGSSTTFQVTFDPSALGARTGTLSIANDDADENPYDFAIQGTGAVYSWNVATGTWNTAGNWNPNGVPSANDDALITNGGTNDLDITTSVSNLTVGGGSVLRKDATGNARTLTVGGVFTNAGTVANNQGSAYLALSFSTSTGNANSGAIRADGRELRMGGRVNNSGGVIEGVNGGYLSLNVNADVTNGSLNADSTSTIDITGANNNHNLRSVGVSNAGTLQMLVSSYARTLTFSASGGLTNSGTVRFRISGGAGNQGGVTAAGTFDSGTTLNNTGASAIYIENTKTNGLATDAAYVDIKGGANFINSGTIAITSPSDVVYGTAQLRSSANLTNAGVLIVDGVGSSIQMAGKTNTQSAGTLDIKNGGSVVAAAVEINGGTLAGNGSITGNLTLASGVTNAWTYTNGVAGAMTVSGTLTLPAAATVAVSGGGAFPNPATLFTATSLTGAVNLVGWTITGTNGYAAQIVGNSVVLAVPVTEMDVRGNGVSITNGDNTPVVSDNTDFGAVGVTGGSNVLAFTILNLGTLPLNLTGTPIVVVGGADSNDFAVTLAPVSPVAAGSSTTFQVTFDPSAVGLRSASLSIANNDADEDPYTFSLQGTGTGVSAPEMDVQGNGVSIADGANAPAASNHTDFGVALVTGGTVVRTFTIRNLGDVTLNLTGTPVVAVGGMQSNDFAVTLAPAASVAPNSLTTFQVTFDPSAVGVRSATLSIANDDADENPYDFAIQGTGAVYSWNVATGTWNTAANWTPNGVPSTNDDVFITNGGTNDLDVTASVTNLTMGSGNVLRKDATSSPRNLTVGGVFANAGTVANNQGSAYLALSFSTSTGNANSGAIRADGRELRLGGTLNNAGGLIEAVNGGYLNFSENGTVTNGTLSIDAVSTSQYTRANGTHNFNGVRVNNAGVLACLVNSYARSVTFSTSGGLTNSGTVRLNISGGAGNQGGVLAACTFNSGTTLNNTGTGAVYVENTKTNGLATDAAYIDIKAGATFINSGTIAIASPSDVVHGTAQLRSSVNLTNAGTLTVDGLGSSIQMAGRTNTQTAGTLDIKNGGSVVASAMAINGGTLAGNGSITGNVTLASGITRAWSYTNGVAGALTIAGTLTLPAIATVQVSGGGDVPEPATVFTATSLSGASDLSGWTVTGLSGYWVRLDGNSVIIERFFRGSVFKFR